MKGIFTRKAIVLALGSALGAGALVGCSGGGGSGSAGSGTLTGVFIDAPVGGLHFWSPSHHGYTDADGKFNYTDGETVTFDFGPLKLGGATGKGVITPMDLMARDADSEVVQAIARTLLQLDEDNDSSNGIKLNDTLASLLNAKLGGKQIDFTQLLTLTGDDDRATPGDELSTALAELDSAVDAAVAEYFASVGMTSYVTYTYDDAVSHLVNEDMYRKNVSKTPELPSSKAKLNQLDAYTPAMAADETPITPDAEGNCSIGVNLNGGGVCMTKPLIITYTDVDKRYGSDAAPDAFAAVSRDDGASWKRVNLSRTGDRIATVKDSSGATVLTAKGASRKPVMMTKANYVAVTWSDHYCTGGSPAYSLKAEDGVTPLYEDIYGVAGRQGLVDYVEQDVDADRMPSPAQVPFSCVWAARGWVDPVSGSIAWSKAERLTSGRRDAYQLTIAGAEDAGFAITWQEDPEGLQAGSGDGPGDGFSGATVAHQTDIWYSSLPWSQFATPAAIDPAATEEDVDDDANDPILLAAGTGGVSPLERTRLERFGMPVRISDNAACNYANLSSDGHKWCRVTADGSLADLDADDNGELDIVLPPAGEEPSVGSIDISSYAMVNCSALVWVGDSSIGWVCQRPDGRLLDGDTGASRPNLFLQAYTPSTGPKSAWAIMGYEETKGLGSGPTDVDAELQDEGKNVIYHSFDFLKPDVIARGDIVNLPELTRDTGTPTVMVEGDETHAPVYATENARRVRFILQGAKAAKGADNTGDGTVLIAIYKQGPEGKGRPSDIFARRMTIKKPDGTFLSGNPYKFANFVCEQKDTWGQCLKGAQNLSSVTPVETLPPGNEDCTDPLTCYDKLVSWNWSVDNLDDESWATPMSEARAHRGQIRGDFVIMGYSWTPNWSASRKGHDKFDFYVRRSFDGGQTWTTDPAATEATTHCKWTNVFDGESGNEVLDCSAKYGVDTDGVTIIAQPEPPRNVSLLKSHMESVIEPRIVAVDGTLLCGDVPCTPEDKQNPSRVVLSYGLANNTDVDGDGELEQEEQYPTDMYFTRTTDFGTTYRTIYYPSDDETLPSWRWDWLAKRDEVEEGEAQLRITPDGNKMYATWLAESMSIYSGPDHFYGSDIWFRRVDFADLDEPAEEVATTSETTSTGGESGVDSSD